MAIEHTLCDDVLDVLTRDTPCGSALFIGDDPSRWLKGVPNYSEVHTQELYPGVDAVFIVHPVAAQRELAERVQSHWVSGSGARRIPTREPAMALLRIWLFGLYLASMESYFLDRADPTWFTFLLAVFGLHYLAQFEG